MKDFIVTHTFKSEEARQKHFSTMSSMSPDAVKGALKKEAASFQMNWGNQNAMVTYCWWKADTPEDILRTLGDFAELYHNDIKEMTEVHDFSD
ncbi:MAG: hypothetical protein Q8M31_09205 [Beijerinckiaceae bacterium]|nr:hypothetical protein [Beijerinckiaceae bacterium]